MKKHDIVNKLTVALYHLEKAHKRSCDLGMCLIGVDIRNHIAEARYKIEEIDRKIYQDITKLKPREDVCKS